MAKWQWVYLVTIHVNATQSDHMFWHKGPLYAMEVCGSTHNPTTLNIPMSEGDTNSCQSQSYQGFNFFYQVTKSMNTCSFTIDFKKISVCLWLGRAILSVNSANFRYFHWKVASAGTLMNSAKCMYFHAKLRYSSWIGQEPGWTMLPRSFDGTNFIAQKKSFISFTS